MTTEQPKSNAEQIYSDDTSPDSLMGDFRGRPIVKILFFTLLVHVVLVGVFSIGYLKNQLVGEDTSAMSKDKRLELAVRDATKALRGIAERYEMSPQELSSQFAAGKPRSASASPNPKPADPGDKKTPPDGKKPDSTMGKILKKTETGPDVPDLAPKEDDDLFK
jgi:hypothetical protein